MPGGRGNRALHHLIETGEIVFRVKAGPERKQREDPHEGERRDATCDAPGRWTYYWNLVRMTLWAVKGEPLAASAH